MKKVLGSFTVVVAMLLLPSLATAGSFYFITNQIGYQGTITNETDGTGPWQTAEPIAGERNADVFLVQNAPQIYSDFNALLSSWFSHHQSNQNDSFMQLYVDGHVAPWIGDGGWDPTLTVFTASVTGSDTPYPWSRFWQPDGNTAAGVTFIDYAYSLTATFGAPAIVDTGWYVNGTLPLSIVGSFVGTFVSDTSGDTYSFNILLNSAWSTPPDYSYDGQDYSPATFVGTPVPEPGTIGLLGLGLLGLARSVRRRATRQG